MESVAVVALSICLLAAIVLSLVARERSDALWRAQVERLERLLAAKTLGEAAAVERMYASPPEDVSTPKADPNEIEQLWADPPPRREKR